MACAWVKLEASDCATEVVTGQRERGIEFIDPSPVICEDACPYSFPWSVPVPVG